MSPIAPRHRTYQLNVANVCMKHLERIKVGKDCESCVDELPPADPIELWIILIWDNKRDKWKVSDAACAISHTEKWGNEKLIGFRRVHPKSEFKLMKFTGVSEGMIP